MMILSFNDFFMMTWERENKSKTKNEPQIPRILTQHSESGESINFIENPI